MIGWIKGTIIEKHAPNLLLDVNGVGYELQAPMTTFYLLPEAGAVALHTHFVVREDAQLLFGFFTREERNLFRLLLKVNGVGPKMALAILSGLEPDRLAQCVQANDMQALVKIPGVGKKTAERLLVELRDLLKGWQGGQGNALPQPMNMPSEPYGENAVLLEAESALVALGYKPVDATRMVAAARKLAEGEVTSPESLIRQALKKAL